MPDWIAAVAFFALMGFMGVLCYRSMREEHKVNMEKHYAQIAFYERITDKLSKEDSKDA